ncbi:unnamed protein product [Phyllotreta striolata]|uniref:Protein YIF1 n=1 Tax=Phyllotreta striolata TaxID=444603 RepID=A0A9N9TT54_PHYSR|nr:unnamed protein product [Phyllotreta striolata]
MHYNANMGGRQPLGRKLKRVADVNSMGYTPYEHPEVQQQPQQQNMYTNVNSFQAGYPQVNSYPSPSVTPNMNQPAFNTNSITAPSMNVISQPIVQDMAMQYGQQLAGAGKTMLKNEVEKFVPVSKLKYYFAVDTNYVLTKMLLLFFPFTHKDWSVKYEQDGPIQPRYEINAPDLYIPIMGFATYVVTAGLALGMQDRFTPEHIVILASSALAWWLVEIVIYWATLYIIQVETSLSTLDLLAYSGYKFVGIIFSIDVSIVAGKIGYYSCLLYTSLTLAFFLIRSLKVQVLSGSTQQEDYYGTQSVGGHKRRLYFLLFLGATQPILSWWLSYHLLPAANVVAKVSTST